MKLFSDSRYSDRVVSFLFAGKTFLDVEFTEFVRRQGEAGHHTQGLALCMASRLMSLSGGYRLAQFLSQPRFDEEADDCEEGDRCD